MINTKRRSFVSGLCLAWLGVYGAPAAAKGVVASAGQDVGLPGRDTVAFPDLEEVLAAIRQSQVEQPDSMWPWRGEVLARALWPVMVKSALQDGGSVDANRFTHFVNLDNLTEWSKKYPETDESREALRYIGNVPYAYDGENGSHPAKAHLEHGFVALALAPHPDVRKALRNAIA